MSHCSVHVDTFLSLSRTHTYIQQDTEKARAVQSGVALFYEILDKLNINCRQFPLITPPFQEFIQHDPPQTLRILECLLNHPSKADLLAPLFHPNNCPGQFLEMYGNVETVARKEGLNMAFSVLTKVGSGREAIIN